ncbi:hypothetical protein GCM10011349_13240 [Novosphingobium indicum]|uniref:Uncharacterized protein n=1 Tax=Novosphingobium indicum TaxID=462949 RepID=A0ABQ2JI91_9SPHN|nr:hypothetical protein GCM10011349_13240 [Novosphingobium indicum]
MQMEEFVLHRSSGRRRQNVCHTFGRTMCTVRSRKGIVHIEIAEFGQRSRKIRIIRFLASMEAGIFEQDDIAIFQLRYGGLRHIADAIITECHGAADGSGERGGNGLQRQLRHGSAPGAAEMGQYDDACTPFGKLPDCGHLPVDPGRVGDPAVVDRYIQIGAHKYTLALHIKVVESGVLIGHVR